MLAFHMVFRTCEASDERKPNDGPRLTNKIQTSRSNLGHIHYLFDRTNERHADFVNRGNENAAQRYDCDEVSWPTLGRYGSLVVRVNQQPLCRCPLPNWQRFPPFFMRREVWISTWLENQERDKGLHIANIMKMIPLAFLYVRLHRFYERMDFLNWLNNIFRPDHQTKMFDPDDFRVFLTDGWADLVIIFFKKNKKKDSVLNEDVAQEEDGAQIQAIRAMRKYISNHFLVAGTEFVPTPWFMDAVAKSPDLSSISVKFRLKNHALPVLSNPGQKLLQGIRKLLKDHKIEKPWNIIDTHGDMDMILSFPVFPSGLTFEKLCNILNDKTLDNTFDKAEIFINQGYEEDEQTIQP